MDKDKDILKLKEQVVYLNEMLDTQIKLTSSIITTLKNWEVQLESKGIFKKMTKRSRPNA